MKTYLGLWTIAPVWAKRLSASRMSDVRKEAYPDLACDCEECREGVEPVYHAVVGKDDHRTDLSDAVTCIVGEAHLWSSAYRCGDCKKFADDFWQKKGGPSVARQKAFVEHFHERHSAKVDQVVVHEPKAAWWLDTPLPLDWKPTIYPRTYT